MHARRCLSLRHLLQLIAAAAVTAASVGLSAAPNVPAQHKGKDATAQKATSTIARQCGAMYPNEYLPPGYYIPSCNGQAELHHQTDGNVVEYVSTGALWDTGTWGRSTSSFIMQTDGNLVLYDSGGAAIWSSGTWGNPGAWLAVQNDCNLVIYSSTGGVLWATNRFCP